MYYRGFKIVNDDYGYCIYKGPSHFECGFFHTYNQAISAIDRYYSLKEI